MGDKTGIQWTDATWNVFTGCTPISPGCDHCYAKTVAETRMRARYLARPPVLDSLATRADPFAPRVWPERLDQPVRWKRPRRIFVNSMSDVFHAHFSTERIREIFDVMRRADWHQYQVLTKRPERARRLWSELEPIPKTLWLGVSVETPDYFRRLDELRQIPAPVRFVSFEPLLADCSEADLRGIDWAIIGGESGRGARVCLSSWIRRLIWRSREFGTRPYVKQLGGETDKRGEPSEWPDDLRVREYPLERAAAAAHAYAVR